MTVVLLSSDLTVLSRVEGAANRQGKAVQIASTGPQALDRDSAGQAELLIIDLSLPSLDVEAIVGQLKSKGTAATRIIAFGPHVHEMRLNAARDAGCDLVVSRGRFFAQLDSILAQ